MRKIRVWTKIWTSDLQISSLALYDLSYPGYIERSEVQIPIQVQIFLLNLNLRL